MMDNQLRLTALINKRVDIEVEAFVQGAIVDAGDKYDIDQDHLLVKTLAYLDERIETIKHEAEMEVLGASAMVAEHSSSAAFKQMEKLEDEEDER